MAKLLHATTVVRDGFHNAFTDLLYWQNSYWVSYRKGTAHISCDAEAVLAVSDDRRRFREMGRLRMPGDVRDPKMVAMSQDRMAVIFPAWVGGHAKRSLQQYVSFTEDGMSFTPPVPVLERNQWLWRVVKYNGRYYGACYDFPAIRDERPYILRLLVSDDMLHWETLSRIGDDSISVGETGLHFRPDGELWAVMRQNKASAIFAAAKPPYVNWEVQTLNTLIHSPVILQHKDNVYVAGRRDARLDPLFPFASGMSTAIWHLERGKVTPVLHLPTAGDCAYPGLIVDPDGRVLISYYSQHVYLDGSLPRLQQSDNKYSAADVYFAELDLDLG